MMILPLLFNHLWSLAYVITPQENKLQDMNNQKKEGKNILFRRW